jgi:hypothetical protein
MGKVLGQAALAPVCLHRCLPAGLPTLGKTFRIAQYEQNLPMMKKTRQPEIPPLLYTTVYCIVYSL